MTATVMTGYGADYMEWETGLEVKIAGRREEGGKIEKNIGHV